MRSRACARRPRRLWAVAMVLTLSFAISGCFANETGGPSGGSLLSLVNGARAANGLPPLAPCTKLDAAAHLHAHDMWANGINTHAGSGGSTVGPRASQQGYAWTTVAENIAWGYATVEQAFNSWMNSPSHRANILNPGVVHHGWAHVGDRWVEVVGAGIC